MIFARRALQRRLDELRESLGGDAVDDLVGRLNRPGADRLSAMWEVVLLHPLAVRGTLQHEAPLDSGRRPDVALEIGDLQITADITTVSDEGLDEANPFFELQTLIEAAKTKLGYPIGGLNLQVSSKRQASRGGVRTTLKLPPRSTLRSFVRDKIVPRLREHRAHRGSFKFSVDEGDIELEVSIDPARGHFSSGGFAAYNVPQIRDRNPLYNALKGKAGQLRGAPGLVGVIVCDGGSRSMLDHPGLRDGLSPSDIVGEFFRQYSSVHFVWLVKVREHRRSWADPRSDRRLLARLLWRPEFTGDARLEALLDEVLAELPRPIMTPVNGALRARETGYGLGFHGGYEMSGSKIRVSLRELTEVLAGLRTFADNGALNVEAARRLGGGRSRIQAYLLACVRDGRLPRSIQIVPGGENETDDWVEIVFGEPDPAVSPFR